VVVKNSAQGRHDGCSRFESAANVVIGEDVEIALSEAYFGIVKAVPLGGKRAKSLGSHLQTLHPDTGLFCAGAEERSSGRDEVAEVEYLERVSIVDLTQGLLVQKKLNFPRSVAELGEGGSAHAAKPHQAAGNVNVWGRLVIDAGHGIGGAVTSRRPGGVGGALAGFDLLELRAPRLE